ncbi:hypothetical protein NKH18_18050 [Streptomyces sp. M10(2022)]
MISREEHEFVPRPSTAGRLPGASAADADSISHHRHETDIPLVMLGFFTALRPDPGPPAGPAAPTWRRSPTLAGTPANRPWNRPHRLGRPPDSRRTCPAADDTLRAVRSPHSAASHGTCGDR